MSHSDHSDEDQQGSRKLLVFPSRGGVLRECLGSGPDAKKTHPGEVSAGGPFMLLSQKTLTMATSDRASDLD